MNLDTYVTGAVQTKAYRLLRDRVYGVLLQYDLTPTHWAMLGMALEARDGVRQVDVAKQLHVKAPMVTMLVRTLLEKDLVQSVTNQFDARAKLLAITPTGRKFIKAVETDMSAMLGQLLIGLTEADMQTYHKVLTTIINNDKRLDQAV